MTLVKHQIQFNSSCNLDLVKLWSKSGYCVATYNLTLNKLVKIWIMSRSSQSLVKVQVSSVLNGHPDEHSTIISNATGCTCYAVNQKDDTVDLLRDRAWTQNPSPVQPPSSVPRQILYNLWTPRNSKFIHIQNSFILI